MIRLIEFVNIIFKDVLLFLKNIDCFIWISLYIFGMICLYTYSPTIATYTLISSYGICALIIILYICVKIIKYLKIRWRQTDHKRSEY